MRLLKDILFRAAMPAMLLTASSFTWLPRGEDGEKVMIDGKEVQNEKVIELEKDDTVYLEAFGIKPKSEINVKVIKLGVKWAEDVYEVDETGTVKAIMHVPEQRLTVNCEVSYTSGSGEFVEKEFKFKVR
jgi:hypothetical protein